MDCAENRGGRAARRMLGHYRQGKWVEIKTHADPHLIVTAERKLRRCILNGEPSAGMGQGGRNRPFATRRCRVGSMSSARSWASMRSPRYRRPRSTRAPGSSISPRSRRMPRGNGLRRTGRSAPLARPARRTDGSGADLCPALCPVHAGGYCRRR